MSDKAEKKLKTPNRGVPKQPANDVPRLQVESRSIHRTPSMAEVVGGGNGAAVARISPVEQLRSLTANLDQSRSILNEALGRVGLYSLSGKEIGSSVENIVSNFSSINSEFHDEGDDSAIATMQLTLDLFVNLRSMLTDIVHGVEAKDGCGEDTDSDEDRSEYGAERTKSGRHVAQLFDRFTYTQTQVRNLLDRISISVLGNSIELPCAAQRSSDAETMGILFMLESVTERTNNTMEAVNALTYRINEVL